MSPTTSPTEVGGSSLSSFNEAAGATEYVLPPLPNTLFTRDTSAGSTAA